MQTSIITQAILVFLTTGIISTLSYFFFKPTKHRFHRQEDYSRNEIKGPIKAIKKRLTIHGVSAFFALISWTGFLVLLILNKIFGIN